MPVSEVVDLDVMMVAVAVRAVLTKVLRQLPRSFPIIQVRLSPATVDNRVETCTHDKTNALKAATSTNGTSKASILPLAEPIIHKHHEPSHV